MAGGWGGEGAEGILLNTSVSPSSDPEGRVCVPRKVCCSTEWWSRRQTAPVLIPWLMPVLLGFGGFCLGGVQYSVSPSGCSFSAQVGCSGAYCRHQMSYLDKKKNSSHLFVCLAPPWVPSLQTVIKTSCHLKAFSLWSLPSRFMVMFELVFARWM